MDMRNALLNFKVSQTVVKLLVPSIEDFVENMAEIRSYTLECKPKESLESLDKLTNGFDRGGFLKPFADYILYEYRNRRLRTVFEPKDHESALLRLFRKEKSIQEENGHPHAVSGGGLPQMEGAGAGRGQIRSPLPLPRHDKPQGHSRARVFAGRQHGRPQAEQHPARIPLSGVRPRHARAFLRGSLLTAGGAVRPAAHKTRNGALQGLGRAGQTCSSPACPSATICCGTT